MPLRQSLFFAWLASRGHAPLRRIFLRAQVVNICVRVLRGHCRANDSRNVFSRGKTANYNLYVAAMPARRCNLYNVRDLRRFTASVESACAFFEHVDYARKADVGKHFCIRCQTNTKWHLRMRRARTNVEDGYQTWLRKKQN